MKRKIDRKKVNNSTKNTLTEFKRFVKDNKKAIRNLAIAAGIAALSSLAIDATTYEVAIVESAVEKIPLYNENGKKEDPIGYIDNSAVIIIDDKKTVLFGPDLYKVVSLTNSGEPIEGYIEESNIGEKKLRFKNEYNTTYSVINTDTVNVRSAPSFGEDYISDSLPKNSYFIGKDTPIVSKENDLRWIEGIYFSYNESKDTYEIKRGFISADYLQRTEPSSLLINKIKIVSTSNVSPTLNLRSEPSTEADIITKINNNSQVFVIKENINGDVWSYIKTGDYTGYVASEYLIPNPDAIEKELKIVNSINDTGIVLKKTCSKNSADLIELPNGSIVSVIKGEEKIADAHEWSRIEYTNDNITYSGWGYTSSLKNAEELIEKKVNLENSTLKLREQPNTNSKILLELPNDKSVFVTKQNFENPIFEDEHEWIKIQLSDGTSGYVAKEYLADIEKNKNESLELNEDKKTQHDETFENKQNFDGYTYSTVNDPDLVGPQVLVLDLSSNPENLRNKLENGINIQLKGNTSAENYSVNAVIIKLGATEFGSPDSSSAVRSSGTNTELVAQIIEICENYKIPYGYYFYSTCVDSKDALLERNLVTELVSEASEIYTNNTGKTSSPTFPLFIDVEFNEKDFKQTYLREDETQEDRIKRISLAKATLLNELSAIYGEDNVGLYTHDQAFQTYDKSRQIADPEIIFENLDNPDLPVWYQACYRLYRKPRFSFTIIL